MVLKLLTLILVLTLVACASPAPRPSIFEGSPIGNEVEEESVTESTEQAAPPMDMVRRAMIIADILFEARRALDENRLMSPRNNNAYDRFREVLIYDPGNKVANEGLDMIVQRYVQLANAASKIGDFDEARLMLSRARSVGRLPELIADGQSRLQEAEQMDFEYFSLDPEQLNKESRQLMSQLREIAQQLYNDEDARFLITARSDEEGRRIYSIMREAIGGYRLRGNISIGNELGVQIQYPF